MERAMAKVKKGRLNVNIPLGMLMAIRKQCRDTNCFMTDFVQTAMEREYIYRKQRMDEFSDTITNAIRKVGT